MTRAFISLGFLPLVLVGCRTPGSSESQAQTAVATEPPLMTPPTQPIEEREEKYPNGNLQIRYSGYVDADGGFVRHGTTTVWYENGQIKAEQAFFNGIPHGPQNKWHVTGHPWTSGRYVEGLEDGTWRTYYKDGTLQLEWTMRRGVFNGWYIDQHTNGKKRLEVEFVDGKRQGPSLMFDDQGVITSRSDFVDGVEQP